MHGRKNMDFIDKIKNLSERVISLKGQVKTEEAAKNACVMPFLQILEYDVFNPEEVIPEFTADVGTKKGEKVDYAIQINKQPTLLIECKCIGENLEKHDVQLYRYFSVTQAKFAILTDGIIYKFYSDLEESNKMDKKPFFIFNIAHFEENEVHELKKFCKSSFDISTILSTANELKYTREIKSILINEYNSPSEDFVKFFASRIHEGRLTQNIIEKYTGITQKAFKDFINEVLKEKIKSIMNGDSANMANSHEETAINEEKEESKTQIETTIEELEGFAIIKSILRNEIELSRITYKDTVRYFNVTIDNNIRKTLCRLYLNTKQKYIAFINDDKKEEKQPIEVIDNLYDFSDLLKEKLEQLK